MDSKSITGYALPKPTEQTRYHFSANPREHALLIAALIAWQRMPIEERREYDSILTNNGQHRPLSDHELGVLAVRINAGEH